VVGVLSQVLRDSISRPREIIDTVGATANLLVVKESGEKTRGMGGFRCLCLLLGVLLALLQASSAAVVRKVTREWAHWAKIGIDTALVHSKTIL